MKTKVSPAPKTLQKAPTGIRGLDEITGGGLPAGRPTLVCGGAGSGKTLLHDILGCSPSSKDEAIGAAEMAELRKEFAGEGIGGLVEIFREEGPAVIARIAAAVAGPDAEAIRRAAHELKGACVNFGARPLEAICQEMESAGQAGNTASAAPLLAQVRVEFQRVQAALEQSANYESQS